MASITWGKSDARCNQGWAKLVRPGIWSAHWSEFWDTPERDGPVLYADHMWSSANKRYISYPYAVMDDFGFLVPVSAPL